MFFGKVKLQHRESKNVLEFPFCCNFADDEGVRVAERPVLTDASPFPAGLSQIRNTGKDVANYDGLDFQSIPEDLSEKYSFFIKVSQFL